MALCLLPILVARLSTVGASFMYQGSQRRNRIARRPVPLSCPISRPNPCDNGDSATGSACVSLVICQQSLPLQFSLNQEEGCVLIERIEVSNYQAPLLSFEQLGS